MTPLKIGGKSPGDPLPPSRMTPPVDHAPADVPMDINDPYADPFPVPDVSDPALAASYLAECGIWAQQWISEIAALARKHDRLRQKLYDPKLADSPHRPDAIRTARAMEDELIAQVRDAAWHEASSDRTWCALTPAPIVSDEPIKKRTLPARTSPNRRCLASDFL